MGQGGVAAGGCPLAKPSRGVICYYQGTGGYHWASKPSVSPWKKTRPLSLTLGNSGRR